jgi:hypothetical protein
LHTILVLNVLVGIGTHAIYSSMSAPAHQASAVSSLANLIAQPHECRSPTHGHAGTFRAGMDLGWKFKRIE